MFGFHCTGVPADAGNPCVQVGAGGAATVPFSFPDLASVTLPANSTDTLICHWATSNISYGFSNPTANPVTARISVHPTYRIESTVLQDPALGLNGQIDITLPGTFASRTLAPGAQEAHAATSSRDCISGLVNKSQLMRFFGLTEKQATRFFKEPITIRAGVQGEVLRVPSGAISYGTRFTGDHK